MLIDCPYCESKVDAKVLASIDDLPFLTSFVQCPSCKEALVSYQELEHQGFVNGKEEWNFGKAHRLWPQPEKTPHHSIPELVNASLVEAEKCYRAKAYYACAVMCGRALESICADHQVINKSFGSGLKELLEKGVIDKRLYEWSEALRKRRNIAAHASNEKITKKDARFLIDFANAISDYIYVLTSKFEEFMSKTDVEVSK